MSTVIPSVPTLAQLISKVLMPCLPHILSSEANPAIHDPVLKSQPMPEVEEFQLQAGLRLWDALWPDISQDYETVTAVQHAAREPASPLWRSTLEQGLIGIFSRNQALTDEVSQILNSL